MRRMILGGALLLSACATAPERPTTVRYVCTDGRSFFARFNPAGVVLDFGGGVAVSLDKRPGGPEGAYTGAAEQLQVQGHDATLTEQGKAPVTCQRGDIRDFLPPQR